MNSPEDLKNHKFKLDEAKIFRLKSDTVSRESLGLVETLGYLTIHGGFMEYFFDYGYSKENSKVLYSHYKMKIPNSFLGTIFNRHRIQYEFGALDMESSKTYFFLPSTPDRIEEIKRYMNSVNLIPIDIEFDSKMNLRLMVEILTHRSLILIIQIGKRKSGRHE